MFYEKGVYKKIAIFKGKRLIGVFSVIQTCNFIEKRRQNRCFPLNIAKLLRTPILKKICKRMVVVASALSKNQFKVKFCSKGN